MAVFCPLSVTPVLDSTGAPIVGAYVRFYDAGTTVARTAYSDGLLTAAYDANDIRTSSSGRIPKVWLQGATAYKVRITSAAGALIEEIDNLPGETMTSSGGGGGGSATYTTGQIVPLYGTGSRTGLVRMNARTIGSAASGATERANDDTENLFIHLWDQDPNLTVSGGRGASAALDWAANKTITLPDARNRGLFGLGDMGGTNANRLSGITFAYGNGITLGANGGEAGVTLTAAHLPIITVTGTISTVGDHAHTGAALINGAHSHGGSVTTSTAGDHAHTYTTATDYANVEVGTGSAINEDWTGTTSATTSTAGAHSHTLTILSDGDHQHTLSINAAGSHSHTFTANSFGSGQAHPNLPPFLLVTLYIAL